MRFLRDLPIRRKLTVITLLTTALGLALACGAFGLYEHGVLRRDLVSNLSSTAEMVGFNSASALSFNDPASARETLRSLATQPHIVAAAIYGRDGTVFASYRRDAAATVSWPAAIPPVGEEFGRDWSSSPRRAFEDLLHWFVLSADDDWLDLVRDIRFSGEKIGAVYFRSDLRQIQQRLARSMWILAGVLLGAGVIAGVVAARLQRVIAEPVVQLAAVAARVTSDKSYALRATKHGNDEIGALIDGFNAMLAQIQARDASLQKAHDELETRVAERTRALTLESAGRRLSEEERDGFFTLSLDLLCIAGEDGLLKRVNPAFEAVLGYLMADLTSTRIMELVHPEDVRVTAARVKRLMGGRAVRNFENRVRHQDGSYRWITWSVTPIPGKDYFYACGRDTTELREAHERATREQARFKFIFDSVPVGIALVTPPPQRTHLVNLAHEQITGVSVADSQNPGVFERASHPDDYRRQLECAKPFLRGEVDHYSVEKRYVHPGGRMVWAVLTSRMFTDPATGKQQCMTTLVDITALKRAQDEVTAERARFKFIFDSVPVGISLIVPGQWKTHVVNPAHLRMTGVSAEELLEPGVFERVTHPDDYVRQREMIKKYKAGEIDHFMIEKRYLHPGGKVVWVSLERRMFTDAISGRQQSMTTLIDITERKLAEAKLAETHKQLLDTSRQAGMAEVATGVLHNVGNVLNSVNVSTTLIGDRVQQSKIANVGKLGELLAQHATELGRFLTEDPRGQKIPGFVQTLASHLAREQADVLKEIESLRKNVEHIKDIVAMQQNYAKVCGVAELVPVADLIEDALRMNASGLARHDIAIVREIPVNPTVTVEKHKVLQILVNLMRNAKYACEESDHAAKRMTLRVSVAGPCVRIAVIDNGVGIPAENLTRIFSHGFTTRKHGHGFGLHSGAIAAKELGGALSAHSEGPGRGAAFTLELPLEAASRAA